jgi:hypothetical protein
MLDPLSVAWVRDVLGEGPEVFLTPPDIAPPRAVAVTIEAAGGVPAPTNPAFMAGAPRG